MTDQPRRATHYLKTWPKFFEPIARGTMPFDVRRNDRDFRAGDTVVMYEYDPDLTTDREGERYTGREVRGIITSLMDATAFEGALGADFVALGIEWTDGIHPKT